MEMMGRGVFSVMPGRVVSREACREARATLIDLKVCFQHNFKGKGKKFFNHHLVLSSASKKSCSKPKKKSISFILLDSMEILVSLRILIWE